MESRWDCIVVGGGAAGLSAALVLGRARKRTLVVDAGGQSNLSAHGIGGLLGHNGLPPAELYAAGRRELAEHPNVEFRAGEVLRAKPEGDDFALELADGSVESTRRVLLATGMDYRYPDVPGIEERWGGSVFHCPFCHGWEVRDRKIGVLDPGDSPAEKALLIRGWSDDVTLYTHGPAEIEPGDAERLAEAGIEVEKRPIAGLRGSGEELDAITFEDDEERACAALLVAVTLHQRSPSPSSSAWSSPNRTSSRRTRSRSARRAPRAPTASSRPATTPRTCPRSPARSRPARWPPRALWPA